MSGDSVIHWGSGVGFSGCRALCLRIIPTSHRRCQSCVGSSLHSVMKSSAYLFGGSSIVYALASTVSPKRRRGDLSFLAELLRYVLVVR